MSVLNKPLLSVNSSAVTGLLTQHDVIRLDLWLLISILSESGLPLPTAPQHITAVTILLPLNGIFNLLLPVWGQAVFLPTFLTATWKNHPSDSETTRSVLLRQEILTCRDEEDDNNTTK